MLPEFTEQVRQSVSEQIDGIHTAVPGKIVKFDKAKCEAEILPYGKFEKPDGSFIDYPKINEVPVMVFQGNNQKTTIAYPVLPGDECLLIISEYTLDTWRTNAESTNDLKFDLTNAVAIVGMFRKPNPLASEAVDDDALIIEHNENRIIFKGEDEVKVHLKGDTSFITLTPDGITIETTGTIDVKSGGTLSVEASDINVKGDTTFLDNVNVIGNLSTGGTGTTNGDATFLGNVTVHGTTITGGNINLNTHTHPYYWTDPDGAADTSPPNQGG